MMLLDEGQPFIRQITEAELRTLPEFAVGALAAMWGNANAAHVKVDTEG